MSTRHFAPESELEFASLLDRRRRELVEEIAIRLAEAKAERVAPDTTSSIDGGDRAFLDVASEIDLTMAGREAEELREIDAALKRLQEGTFGICANCGAEILLARLRAWPGASRCMACQEELESAHGAAHAPRL